MLEIIDGPPVPFKDMACCMKDISRVNALFGGRMVTMIHVKRLLDALPADRLITVLDVGTGAGDIPRELVRWARRQGRRIRIFALDRDAATLQIAAQVVRDYPEISFLRGDALALPIRAGGGGSHDLRDDAASPGAGRGRAVPGRDGPGRAAWASWSTTWCGAVSRTGWCG